MKERLISAIKVVAMLSICLLGITIMYVQEGNAQQHNKDILLPLDSMPSFYNKAPQDGLWEALIYYDIKHPEIVYAQALLETGHFKSMGCTRDHNLFGLYNSRKREYYKFNHWVESVKAYKEWVQYRYKPPSDYYEFLQRIHYAEDSTYVTILKQIVKKHGKIKQSTSTSHNQ